MNQYNSGHDIQRNSDHETPNVKLTLSELYNDISTRNNWYTVEKVGSIPLGDSGTGTLVITLFKALERAEHESSTVLM